MPTRSLIDGYRKFREKYKSDHEVFDRLAEDGQDPKVMWIGCSDSRVVPELITGADPFPLIGGVPGLGADDRSASRASLKSRPLKTIA